jgi:MinD superfamily P-loop ATPase
MIISVASGKGGTGKTTVATNLALSLNEGVHPVRNSTFPDKEIHISNGVQFLDCDVEEPNAHIFLRPHIEKSFPVTIPIPQIDLAKCNFCGRCAQVCAYNAIAVIKDKVLVFPELCHGCGACSYLCPQDAIKEVGREVGVIEVGKRENIKFVHGRLNIGEAMSPPLIRAVKKCIDFSKTVIIDVPPGTSCPVIESVKGSDFCLLVTEPTPFGLNDLILAAQALKELKIAFAVVVNRSDLGNQGVDDYCKRENIPILMRIPFRKEIAMAYSKGTTIVEALPEYKEKFIGLHKAIIKRIK